MKTVSGFESIMERLKVAMKLRNDKELAQALELNANAFYNRKSARSIPYESVVAVAKRRGLSLDWIFFGVGRAAADVTVLTPSEIEPELIGQICAELEVAILGPGARERHRDRVYRAALVGGLAGHIYNVVAFIPSPKARSDKITAEAEMMVEIEKIANTKNSLSSRSSSGGRLARTKTKR